MFAIKNTPRSFVSRFFATVCLFFWLVCLFLFVCLFVFVCLFFFCFFFFVLHICWLFFVFRLNCLIVFRLVIYFPFIRMCSLSKFNKQGLSGNCSLEWHVINKVFWLKNSKPNTRLMIQNHLKQIKIKWIRWIKKVCLPCLHARPWNPLKSFEILWNPLKSFAILWKWFKSSDPLNSYQINTSNTQLEPLLPWYTMFWKDTTQALYTHHHPSYSNTHVHI